MAQTTAVTTREPTWGKARRITFYFAVGLTLAALAAFPPLLAGPVVAWLDGDTIDSLFGDEGLAIHRVHIEGATLLFWLMIVAMISQFRRPESSTAPLLAAAAAWIVFLPIELTHLVDPFSITLAVLLVAVVALHPRRWPVERVSWRTGPLALAGMATLPALVYAVQEVRLQLTEPAADPHVEGSHYALMAVLALGLALSALLGATDIPGHRISAWTAGIITIVLGVFFIGHTDDASSVATGWGVAMIVWAVAYLSAETRAPRPLESGASSRTV